MSDDLVERVAIAIDNAICDGDQSSVAMELTSEEIKVLARAAIPVCMEEAAKVCDAIENRLTEQWKANYKICDYTQGASDGANDCAAAIRALVKEPQ